MSCIITECFISCNHDIVPVEKIIYVPVKDTISEKNNIARIAELEHKCHILQDSLNIIKDSMGKHFDPKLFVYFDHCRTQLEEYYSHSA